MKPEVKSDVTKTTKSVKNKPSSDYTFKESESKEYENAKDVASNEGMVKGQDSKYYSNDPHIMGKKKTQMSPDELKEKGKDSDKKSAREL